jgi:hypothetical protein
MKRKKKKERKKKEKKKKKGKGREKHTESTLCCSFSWKSAWEPSQTRIAPCVDGRHHLARSSCVGRARDRAKSQPSCVPRTDA